MPLSLPFSPSRLRRRHSHGSSKPGETDRKRSSSGLDSRVFRKIFEGMKQADVEDTNNNKPTPSLPFSRDFGTFDLTLCLAHDGRCVVLVEYDQRVFLNGRQVYPMPNGDVVDLRGVPDLMMKRYYECTLEAKQSLRPSPVQSQDIMRPSRSLLKRHTFDDSRDFGNADYSDKLNPRASVRFMSDENVAENYTGKAEMSARKRSPNFIAEINQIESSFTDTLARLCKMIVEMNGCEETDTESARSEDFISDQCAEKLQTTLTNLLDQFKSMVELNSALCNNTDDAKSNNGEEVECKVQDNLLDSSSEEDKEEVIHVWSAEKDPGGCHPATTFKQSNKRKTETIHQLKIENKHLREEVEALDSQMARAHALLEDMESKVVETEAGKVNAEKKVLDLMTHAERYLQEQTTKEPEPRPVFNYEDSSHDMAFYLSDDSDLDEKEKEIHQCAPVIKGSFLPQLDSKSRNLRSEIRRIRDIYDDVGDSLEKLNKENIGIKVKVSKLERNNTTLLSKLEQEEEINGRLKEDVERLDGLNAALEEQITTLTKDKINLEIQLESVGSARSEHVVHQRVLERKLTASVTTCNSLETEKSEQQHELEIIEKLLLEESGRSAQIANDNAKMEVELSEIRADVEELRLENHQLQAQEEANRASRHRLEATARRNESELKALRIENDAADQEIRSVRSKLGAAKETMLELEKSNDKLEHNLIKTEAHRSALDKQRIELKNEINQIKDRNKTLESMSQKLQRENDNMRDTMGELMATNADIRGRLERWDRENSEMSTKMRRLVDAKSELQGVLKQLNGLNLDIETRFERLDSEYAGLEEKFTGSRENSPMVSPRGENAMQAMDDGKDES